ncbi:MAG: copper resistance protein CopC [Alphaproteobacteria bacterium]
MKTLVVVLLLAASPAFAHAKLVSSDPAAGSSVKSPSMIKMTFAEPLEPAFSTATLSDAGGKALPVPKSVGGATITLLPLALKPGAYTVKWQAVGHDTHKLSGSFGFKVIP